MKGYKTIAFNALMGVIAALGYWLPESAETLPGEAEVSQTLDMFWEAWTSIEVVGNMILRKITSTPMFKRE